MNLNKNIAVSESGFIFNPSTGDSFSTNPIGAEIIQMLKDGKKNAEIVKDLTHRYDADIKIIEKDLDEFLVILRDHYLAQ